MANENTAAVRERFAALLHLGRQQGFVTHSQVNAHLPDQADPELMYGLLALLEEESLELVNDPIVDEPGWLTCSDPAPMLEFLRPRARQRKLRLLAVARCRRSWTLFQDTRSRRAIDVAERLDDGMATEEERREAQEGAEAALTELREKDTTSFSKEFLHLSAPERAATNILGPDAAVAGCGLDIPWCLDFMGNPVAQALLATHDEDEIAFLRDIFGNPFRPVTIDPSWLSWNDGTVMHLAEAIYAERTFERLPILADALEEAGCTDVDILNHCRGPGPHVRGCWLIDSLLGRE